VAIAEVWQPGRGISFLVDRHRHRILKIVNQNVWVGYCPVRGVDKIIYSPSWELMLVLTRTPCPHIDENMFPIIDRKQ